MYKLIEGGVIHPDGFAIPEDLNNRHWQEYLAWLAAGNTALPADPPAPPHESEIARGGARQWFIDNPATQQLFTLTIAELETDINSLVDALFPSATAQNRTRTKKFWMALAVSVRVLVRREFG